MEARSTNYTPVLKELKKIFFKSEVIVIFVKSFRYKPQTSEAIFLEILKNYQKSIFP